MTTASEEKQREEAVPPDSSPETPRGEGRTCASSVTPASLASLRAVTERVRKAGQAASRVAAVLDKPGSLVHSQPPTFRQARDRHHECARHYQAAILRGPRLLWGYFHLLVIMPVLYLVVWVTESPARFLVTAAIIAAVWHFG